MTAAVYIRKSREEAGKPSHRLTVQREQLPAHAKAQGWQVLIYDDGHASAARGKVEDLRERARLEADIRAGRIGVVLCIELSRLSRDDSLQDYVAWLHLCAEHQVKLATPSRTLDPQQPSDWMLLLMEGGFSSVEMKILKKRMADGRRQAKAEGRYLSGRPPEPYRHDPTSSGLVIEAAQLPTVQRILTLCETHSTREVAELTGWPQIKIRRMIADDRLTMYQGQCRHPETGDLIAAQWPAIINADQAARIRAGRRYRKSAPKRAFGGLLSNLGLFVCGYCGRSIRSWSSGSGYYGCKANEHTGTCQPSRMMVQAIIDERVVANLISTLARLDDLRRAWQAAQGTDDTAQRLQTIDRQVEQARLRKQRLIAAIAEGVIDFGDARQQRQQIEQEITELANQRASLQISNSGEPDWQSMAITREEFDVLDITDQRDLIRTAIERIRFYSTHLMIDYRFPRNSNGSPTARVNLPGQQRPGPKRKARISAG